MDRRSLRGIYSVEAALVMPLVLFVLEAIVFLTFWLHDRTILYTVPYYYLRTADREEECLQDFLEEINRECILINVDEAVVEHEIGKRTWRVQVHIDMPGGNLVRSMLGLSHTNVYRVRISVKVDAVTVLRAAHGLIWR